jgi:hypothetical protein
MLSGNEWVQEFDRRESTLRYWRPTWQDIADFVLPRKATITRTLAPGQQTMAQVLDGTAIHDNELLAATMQGTLTSQSIKWFSLRVIGVDIEPGSEEDKWLDECSKLIYETLTFSNFNAESHEFYQDLVGFGTGCLFEQETPFGVEFRAIDVGTFLVEETFDGKVKGVWRKFMLPAQAVVERFSTTVSQKLRDMAAKEPEFQVPVLHVTRPRQLAQYGRAALARPIASYYVDYLNREMLAEGGYHELPYFVTRWAKKSGEEWGRGPGLTALPDIKTLNKLVELKLKALGKFVDPPLKVRDEGVAGTVRLTPGGLTHVRDMDAVSELLSGGFGKGIQLADMDEDKLRIKIDRYFFIDQLQLQPGNPQMTATEVQVRYELMQRVLGPTLGRISTEFQMPVIVRTFMALLRANRLPPMPPKIQQLYRDGRMDVRFEGPLARAQKMADSLALQRFYALAAPLAQSDPSVADVINNTAAMRIHAEALGVPNGALRSEEEILQIRQARLQAQQEAQLQQAQAASLESLGKFAPFVKATADATQQGGSLAGRA